MHGCTVHSGKVNKCGLKEKKKNAKNENTDTETKRVHNKENVNNVLNVLIYELFLRIFY